MTDRPNDLTEAAMRENELLRENNELRKLLGELRNFACGNASKWAPGAADHEIWDRVRSAAAPY